MFATQPGAQRGEQRIAMGPGQVIGREFQRIAPATGVEVNLHIDHWNRRALDQPDPRAAGR